MAKEVVAWKNKGQTLDVKVIIFFIITLMHNIL